MNTLKRSAESAARFSDIDVWRWRRYMGQLCDTETGVNLYRVDHDQLGCRLVDRDLVVPVCIYVAVDDADACLYIGQCMRPNGSVVQRIDRHHAIPPVATALWVMALRPDCSQAALDGIETNMIRAYNPPFNTAHNPWRCRALAEEVGS